jgi:hypothetical protein
MSSAATIAAKLILNSDSYESGLKSAGAHADTFASKMKSVGKTVAIAGAAAATAIVAGAGIAVSAIASTIGPASDLSETINKTNEIFEKSASDIIEWSKTTADALGMSRQTSLDAASTFAMFGSSAGLAGQDLNDFAKQNTTLAADMASFFNTSPEEAITAIGAAFRGEMEPIRKYNVMLDDASMRQAALEMGIISTTKDALTPQQKVLAAQALILKQTSKAQGDFARTSNGLANVQRRLTAKFENIKTVIGTALLPVIEKMAGIVLKFVSSPAAQKWFEDFASSIGKVADRVSVFIDKFSGLSAKFDGWGFKKFFGTFEDGSNIIGGFMADIATLFGIDVTEDLKQQFYGIGKVIGDTVLAVSTGWETAKGIFSEASTVVGKVYDIVKDGLQEGDITKIMVTFGILGGQIKAWSEKVDLKGLSTNALAESKNALNSMATWLKSPEAILAMDIAGRALASGIVTGMKTGLGAIGTWFKDGGFQSILNLRESAVSSAAEFCSGFNQELYRQLGIQVPPMLASFLDGAWKGAINAFFLGGAVNDFVNGLQSQFKQQQAWGYQSTGKLSGGRTTPGFSNGGSFIVPSGFPNDSFPMNVETGEHVTVEKAGTSSDPINYDRLTRSLTTAMKRSFAK